MTPIATGLVIYFLLGNERLSLSKGVSLSLLGLVALFLARIITTENKNLI